MEEADGLVYCTFQNISTARLAGALASLDQAAGQRQCPLGVLGCRLGGPEAGLEGRGGYCLERRRRKGEQVGKSA